MVNSKKAQMKIQQMAFMLIGVFLFFGLVAMIVLTVKISGLKNSVSDLREQNSLLLVTKLASSPEFSCERAFGTEKTDCVDLDKVMMLKENIAKYSNFWGVKNIEIRRIYPENKNISCTTSIYPNCDTIQLMNKASTGYDKYNYVTLCRKAVYNGKIVNKCEMGILIVRWEEYQE